MQAVLDLSQADWCKLLLETASSAVNQAWPEVPKFVFMSKHTVTKKVYLSLQHFLQGHRFI